MSFEIASPTTCGQSLLARATATNQLVFVNAKIETTARTAAAIGSATSLPTLSNPETGTINSVTYSLNQTRVTVRFNNLVTTANFHTVWLMAKLANEADSAAVPIGAVVSQAPIYIPTTSQSATHIDIHLNLSFVRADGTVSITEGPAFTISDHEQFRVELRAELDDIEADIDDLQSTVVTIAGAQTITGNKTFSGTFKVTGSTTLGTTTTGTLTAGTLSSYAHTPRTASTSDATGYDLGASNKRWKYVYGRHGNFDASLSTAGTLSVTGTSTLTGNTTVGGTLNVTGATTLASTLDVTGKTTLDEVTAGNIMSTTHLPTANSTSTSTGSDLGASDTRWRYIYGRYGDFSGSISTAGTLSVTGASTLTGNTTVGGTLDVTGATTLAGVTAGDISSYGLTPRTASTSSSTGYNIGADGTRWKYVYARYGNFSYSVTVTDGITVGGSIARPSGSTATQNIGTYALPFANVYAVTFHGDLDGTADTASYADEAGYCSGNAESASELATARTLDGMSFDGSGNIKHYGTCGTAAETTAKVVTLAGFELATGARIAVKFTYSNTATNPTLNVNGTGAKAICYRGTTAVSGTSNYYRWQANDVVEFIYDGTNWIMVGWQTYAYYAYSATSSTSATYATNLRYSSTNVLTADSPNTVVSNVTIYPSTSGSVSLGSQFYKWNYVYCNHIGDSSNYVTSAYITNMYGTASYATADASGNTITSTYLRSISVGSSSTTFTTYTAAGTTSSASGYSYNTTLTLTKNSTSTVSLTGLVANIIAGTGVGSVRWVCCKTTAVWTKKSSNIYMSGAILYPVDMITSASDSECMIRFNANTSINNSTMGNSTVPGVWRLLNYVGAISKGNMLVALAVRVY